MTDKRKYGWENTETLSRPPAIADSDWIKILEGENRRLSELASNAYRDAVTFRTELLSLKETEYYLRKDRDDLRIQFSELADRWNLRRETGTQTELDYSGSHVRDYGHA